jgi:signal transduction histidine kinase
MSEVVVEMNHLLKNGQSISYVHAGDSFVTLDASMMRHIVTNLLSNAIKFSPEESVVELATENTELEFKLSVRDHGIGVPKDDIANLAKRFFRSSNVTNIQGTGLGLHIVNKYAELMNGELTCNSILGEGTEFTIRFKNVITGL